MMQSGLTKQEIRDQFGEDAQAYINIIDYICSYLDFKCVQGLGLSVSINDFSFDKILVWAWIKDSLDGRKT